jgi:hypothetical protein
MIKFTSLSLVALLGLAPVAISQVVQPAQDVELVEAQAESQELTRLLHLQNGEVLRVRARPTADDGWEIQDGRQTWVALPPGYVLRATLERDALADAKRLEHAIATGPRQEQNTRRVSLAAWLSQQGLVSEALSQLDRVLSADADQKQALALIETLAPRLDVAAIEAAMNSESQTLAILRAASKTTPSLREVALLRLASGGATEELREELRAQLISHSPRLRAAAALALRRIYPGKNLRLDEVRELIRRSVLDGSEEVRAEASRALRDTEDPNVAVSAMRALNSNNPRLRENSIQSLGVMGYPAAVEPLVGYLTRIRAAAQAGKSGGTSAGSIFIGTQTAYVQDFDVEVANAAAIADPQVNVLIEGAVLDARVIGIYTVSYATEARLVRSALGELTGLRLANTNRAWLDWWEKNQVAWKSPKTPSPATATTPAPNLR